MYNVKWAVSYVQRFVYATFWLGQGMMMSQCVATAACLIGQYT